MNVGAAEIPRLEEGGAVDRGLVAGGEVSAPADQIGKHRGEGVEHLTAAVARGVPLGRRREERQRLLPSVWQIAAHKAVEFGGQLGVSGGIGGHQLDMCVLGAAAPFDSLPEKGVDLFGHIKTRLKRPAEPRFGGGQLFFAQRFSVRFGGARSVGAAIADDALDADDAGAWVVLCGAHSLVDGCAAVEVHPALDMPAIALETPGPILGVRDIGLAVDGHCVVVVKIDKFAQTQMAGQAGGFAGYPFHQVAVGDDRIGVVVDHLEAGAVEPLGQPAFGQRHPDTIGEACPQRAGRGLDTRRMPGLWVARGAALPLPETLQLFQGQVVAGQMQHRVEQHRTMACAEHKTVAVKPLRMRRVVAHHARPQRQRRHRHPHRHARMARIGCLNAVSRKHPNRIGCFGLEFM